MIPKYPQINPDRDRIHNFYLCEDVTVTLARRGVVMMM